MSNESDRSAANNPPECLRKAGITRATDNIPEGQCLAVSGSLIFRFFGKELQQRFITGGRDGNTDGSTRPGPGKR